MNYKDIDLEQEGSAPCPIINAEEVRQFVYCKRVIYFRRVMEYSGRSSRLMNEGTKYHHTKQYSNYVRVGDLENLRDRYFLDKIRRIGGKIDLLRVRVDDLVPVEFKRFKNDRIQPSQSHLVQLMIGGMAAEAVLEKPMFEIELRYWRGVKATIEVTDQMRGKALEIVEEIREMIVKQRMPEATKQVNKCSNCEFWRVCRRV